MPGFIGVGPGRCGTESLYRIVGACHGTEVTHESYNSRWYAQDDAIAQLAAKMLTSPLLVGEVNCRMFPRIPYLRSRVPGLPIVCLHRPKAEVVASWMKWIKPPFRPHDRVRHYPEGDRWPDRYPRIDAATPEQSVGFWWEMCETFMESLAPPVLHMGMNDLNGDLSVLFNFLGIPEENRVSSQERKFNTSKQCEARTTLDSWARMRKNSPKEWERLVHG